ncbi:putative FBD-associated F-box protein At3g50710 isoform X1 [Rosa rugosa]|uniref:putative FBD-associated F-box protein At3g50710 isoform X1 n=1 Tax=Rosa rugosa TaxID=74645 RepID=UPI002B41470B|nr:putative FBD-associated F-box protein At3g50710 isoform X1 [Rosa rugosa]
MNSKSKRHLRAPDRISGLSDALLWHILSFVETQDAVRTCILSTRWKNIWASVPTLDFDPSCFRYPSKFLAFVDHVLLLRYSSNIQKFRLHWEGINVDDYRIHAWIHAAIRRNVVELDLCAGYSDETRIFELPKSLVMCKTLVMLRLTSQFITSIPASGCFPSLKSLHVTLHVKVNKSIFDVLSNCPILEDLTMDGSLQDMNPLNLIITAPALKTLRIWFYVGFGSYCYFINCPKLENFYVTEDFPSTYYLKEAKSLVKASIYLRRHCSNEQPGFYRVTELLAEVSNVTYLCLLAHCFEVGSLPAYENLRQLKLVIQDCFCWELLTELLKRSPILESLVLECEVACCLQEGSDLDEGSEYEEGSEHEEGSDHEEGSEYEQGSNHEEGSEHQWNPPDCVPTCCLSHLKIVTIRGFTGKGDELEVAKYLLKYGQVLNKMTISMDRLDLNEKEKIYKEFLMVPRGSRTSIVEFI